LLFGLALHTTTEVLSLAIAPLDRQAGNQVRDRSNPILLGLKQQSWTLGRDLSTQLHSLLAEFMISYDWSDLGFIAIAKGVGGFTGTRIGIVLARTLGEQLAIPVYAIGCDKILQQSQAFQLPQSLGQSLLAIAQEQWLQGQYPDWSEALPLYSE
jgi:tRNA threonylcarbamoyladenosine biosynthesis protein TsaB